MTETILFVGGSVDGKTTDADLVDNIMVPVDTDGWVVMETYRCQILYTGTKEIPVYLISTESPDNLIPLLIEGYRRKE